MSEARNRVPTAEFHECLVEEFETDERFDSSDYVKQLAGMVAGSGFPVLVKPNAWCASHVADYAVKGKHFRARMHAA